MKRPNFFILGAPKCGTTSLAAWLRDHPNVYMSPEKEPHFFNGDDRRGTRRLANYERLFADAADEHLAIGEASVWYLASSKAVAAILEYQPSARFIVMIRNPLEMAPALYGEMVLAGHDNARNFASAWMLQAERYRNKWRPAWIRRRLQYGEVCKVGHQLERLLSLVPRERVLTLVLDDVRANPRAQYLRVVTFLGIPDDHRQTFPIYNSAKTPRWPELWRLMYPFIETKHRLGIRPGLGIWTRFASTNQIQRKRDPTPPELVPMLKKHFHDDVQLLSRILGRDFSAWLT